MKTKPDFDAVVGGRQQGSLLDRLTKQIKRAVSTNDGQNGSEKKENKIPGGVRKDRQRIAIFAGAGVLVTAIVVTLVIMYNRPAPVENQTIEAHEYTDNQDTEFEKPKQGKVASAPEAKKVVPKEPTKPKAEKPFEGGRTVSNKPKEEPLIVPAYNPIVLEDPMVDAAKKSGMFVSAGGSDPETTSAKVAAKRIGTFGADTQGGQYVPVQMSTTGKGATGSNAWGAANQGFYDNGASGGVGGVTQIGPQTVAAGTVISATLITEINSDLPGQILAQVTSNIYDTVSGQNLLIPAGSKMIAQYNSIIGWGQNRVQIGWSRLQRPDGVIVNLQNMLGTDTRGAAGVDADVDGHPFEYLGALGFMIGTQIAVNEIAQTSKTAPTQGLQNLGQVTQDTVSPAINQAGLTYLNRQMERPATLRVRQGKTVALFVVSDLTLPVFNR